MDVWGCVYLFVECALRGPLCFGGGVGFGRRIVRHQQLVHLGGWRDVRVCVWGACVAFLCRLRLCMCGNLLVRV